MKLVITYGCGFIGANLAKKLAADVNKLSLADNFALGNIGLIDAAVNVAIIDTYIRDTTKMREILEGKNAVMHLAACGFVVESGINRLESFSVNVEKTFSVLEVARHSEIRKLIFASTRVALMGMRLYQLMNFRCLTRFAIRQSSSPRKKIVAILPMFMMEVP